MKGGLQACGLRARATPGSDKGWAMEIIASAFHNTPRKTIMGSGGSCGINDKENNSSFFKKCHPEGTMITADNGHCLVTEMSFVFFPKNYSLGTHAHTPYICILDTSICIIIWLPKECCNIVGDMVIKYIWYMESA